MVIAIELCLKWGIALQYGYQLRMCLAVFFISPWYGFSNIGSSKFSTSIFHLWAECSFFKGRLGSPYIGLAVDYECEVKSVNWTYVRVE